MEDTNQSSSEGFGSSSDSSSSIKKQSVKSKKKWTTKTAVSPEESEVLIKVGGLEYKTPGKRQRLVIASIVVGLNVLLVLSVALYFYSPAFQEFIYNVGR